MPRAKPKPAPLSSEPANHSVKDVADHFGVSEDSIYRLVKAKAISYRMVAGLIRFRQSDIDAFERKNAVMAGTTKVSGAAKQRFGMK